MNDYHIAEEVSMSLKEGSEGVEPGNYLVEDGLHLRPSSASPSQPASLNRSFDACVKVAGSFFLFFNSWGILNSFGVFQAYLQTNQLHDYSASDISWIGTFQGFLVLFASFITGPIFDKGYIRTLILTGIFLIVLGLMMTSLSTEYYHFVLAQGICIGIGSSCWFIPSIAIIPHYFERRQALATGIAISGVSIGGVIYPIVFRQLVPQIGFNWALRTMGFLVLTTSIPCMVFMRRPMPPSAQKRPFVDLTAFREPAFNLFTFGMFLAFMALYVPFFYLSIFAQSKIGVDADFSFYLVSIMNGFSAVGRVLPGLVADRIGSLNSLLLFTSISTVLMAGWIGIYNQDGTLAFTCLYGFFSGAIVSLPPTVITGLTKDINIIGTRMGMCLSLAGFGLLVGNPVVGVLVDLQNGVFWRGQTFAACLLASAGLFFALLRASLKQLGYRSTV